MSLAYPKILLADHIVAESCAGQFHFRRASATSYPSRSPEEEKRLYAMDEAQMIESLVSRMPQQTKEQFEHFFLQLQLIVSTATRIRTALEEGTPKVIEEALNDADQTGIMPYIL